MKTVVVNKQHSRYDVDITRNGPYGNPHWITSLLPRDEAIRRFEQDWDRRLSGPNRESWLRFLEPLRGKRLGCVCRPRPCHGDVYVRLLETVRSVVR